MLGPVLRFAGQFHFEMPEANNSAKYQPSPFDPTKSLDDILPESGSDPADYFRFKFRDCSIRSAVDDHGKVLSNSADDPVIGVALELDGYMVDVSPSAICAMIHAGQLAFGSLASGSLGLAVQSALRLNVRPNGFDDISAAAHFTAAMTLTPRAGKSPLLDALAAADLEMGFQLNRYQKAFDSQGNPIPNGLSGDIYGFIRPKWIARASDGMRLANRTLVIHPDIGNAPDIERIFFSDVGKGAPPPFMEIDGYYDFGGQLIALRPLDFIPFLDFAYATPTSSGAVKEYVLYAVTTAGNVDIGRFVGDRAEMLQTGGLLLFVTPQTVTETDRLGVDVVDAGGARHRLMIETEWDMQLQGSRAIALGSRETRLVEVRITHNNRPEAGVTPRLTVANDTRSPTVANIVSSGSAQTDAGGLVRFEIQAADLSDLGGINDPVTGQPVHAAPIHRQYGSNAFITIPNPLRRTQVERIELAIRVVPKVDPKTPPAPVSYARDLAPLLGYYIHMFPWLHTRHSGNGYRRFLDLSNPTSLANLVDEAIRRLELPDEDHSRMPRSRDAPIGLPDLLRRWRDEGFAA